MFNIPEEDLKAIVLDLGSLNRRFANSTVMVTGAAGFLGKIFLYYFQYLNQDYLLNNPVKVLALDNFIIGSPILSEFDDDKNITVIRHDITQPFNLINLHRNQKIDYIISAAGIASPSLYRKYPLETLDVSYLGTKNMMELAYNQECKSILTFSSSEVYSTPPDDLIPTPETYNGACATMDTRSCYDIGKQVLETLSYIYSTHYKIPVKIVRPFNVYSYVHESDTRVLPNFIKAALKNQPLKIYGNNTNTRTFCFITDAIAGFLRALLLGQNGAVYNIGNPNPEITIENLANKVKIITGSNSKIETIPYPSNYPSTEPKRRCPDITKATKDLNYQPLVCLDVGIKKYWNWAKENYFVL